MPSSVEATCQAIVEQMDLSWQTLPISHQFPEPLPLQSVVTLFHGQRTMDQNTFLTVTEAIQFSLERTVLPIQLTARPGGGKSSAMKWIARTFAAWRLQGKPAPSPIYVDLGRFTSLDPTSPIESLLDQLARRSSQINYSCLLAEPSNLVLLLDGLDLMSGVPTARDLVDAACQYRAARFVIAGRPDEPVQRLLDDYPTTIRIQLGSLDAKLREEWFRTHASESAQNRYFSLISSNQHIETLLESPLLFSMAASACIDNAEGSTLQTDVYAGRTGIFAGFLEYAVRRAIWQGNLPGDERATFHTCFGFVGGILLLASRMGYRDRIPAVMIEGLITELRNSKSLQLAVRKAGKWPRVEKILRAIGLLNLSENVYVFLHQQFAEYMAGYALAQSLIHSTTQQQLHEQLASDLRFRDRDAIVSHSLAIVASHPKGNRVLNAAFRIIRAVNADDASEIFSSTAATEAIPFLISLHKEDSGSDHSSFFALSGLSKIPSMSAITGIQSIIADCLKNGAAMVRVALRALANHPLTEGKIVLDSYFSDTTQPFWVRIAAAAELPYSMLRAAHQELAIHAIEDSGADESVRRDGVKVISHLEPSLALRILRRLPIHPVAPIPLPIRMAMADSVTRLMTCPWNAHVAEPLSVGDFFLSTLTSNKAMMERIAQIRESMFPSSAGNAQSDTAVIDEPRILAPEEIPGEINAIVNKVLKKGGSLDSGKQLTQLCNKYPSGFEILESHPSAHLLPNSLIQSCAQDCGRRWIPEFKSDQPDIPSEGTTNLYQNPAISGQVALADITTGTNPPRERKTEAKLLKLDTLMIEYVQELQTTGASSSIATAIEFCKSRKSPYKKSAISANAIWKENKEREGNAKLLLKNAQEFKDEYHQDRSRD